MLIELETILIKSTTRPRCYAVSRWSDGHLECQCEQWRYRHLECKHIAAAREYLAIIDRSAVHRIQH
jgi:hypothetical protein